MDVLDGILETLDPILKLRDSIGKLGRVGIELGIEIGESGSELLIRGQIPSIDLVKNLSSLLAFDSAQEVESPFGFGAGRIGLRGDS